jgi:HNH endonuclease
MNKRTDVFKYIDRSGGADTCWLWTREFSGGGRDNRAYFSYVHEGKKYRRLAYRLVYELFFGKELDEKTVLRHKCDNQRCHNPQHLEEGTQQDNIADAMARDRIGKLSKEGVQHIRLLAEQGSDVITIARIFNVTSQAIRDVLNGKSHKGD